MTSYDFFSRCFVQTVWHWARREEKGTREQCVAGLYREHAVCCDHRCSTYSMYFSAYSDGVDCH